MCYYYKDLIFENSDTSNKEYDIVVQLCPIDNKQCTMQAVKVI